MDDITRFPVKVNFDYDAIKRELWIKAVNWLHSNYGNIGHRWEYSEKAFYFRNIQDLVWFKLNVG